MCYVQCIETTQFNMNISILLLNIFGTLLLSIEAIKIENFEKIIHFIRGSNRILNPKIEWVDEMKKVQNGRSYTVDFFVFLILFGIPAYLILSYFFPDLKQLFKIPLSFLGAFIVWTILILANELLIKILKLIVTNTTKGIIGAIGFILLVISFCLQYIQSTN